jgi:hypothetical protein
MICDICGEPATIYLTRVGADGKLQKMNICENCSDIPEVSETGFEALLGTHLFNLYTDSDGVRRAHCVHCGAEPRPWLDSRCVYRRKEMKTDDLPDYSKWPTKDLEVLYNQYKSWLRKPKSPLYHKRVLVNKWYAAIRKELLKRRRKIS